MLITKLSRKAGRLEKQKFTCELFDYLHVDRSWTWKKKKYIQVPQQNEMLILQCTGPGFTCKNEEYNPKEIIPNSRYLKNLILQKVVKQ